MEITQHLPSLDPRMIQQTIDRMYAAMTLGAREAMILTVNDAQGAALDFRMPSTSSTSAVEPDSPTSEG